MASSGHLNPFLIYDPNRCILCGKCVWVCTEKTGSRSLISPTVDIHQADTALPLSGLEESCAACGDVSTFAPTAALQATERLAAGRVHLDSVQTSRVPSSRQAIKTSDNP